MTYPIYQPNHHSYAAIEQVSHITSGTLLTSDRHTFSGQNVTYTPDGQFHTSASSISGGITTFEEVDPTISGPRRADGWGSGWGGGLEPPKEAPIGDALIPLLLCALFYILRRRMVAKEIQS